MKNLIRSAVFTLLAASTAQAQQAVQWRVQDGGNGHWYRLVRNPVPQPISWTSARDLAAAQGGTLACVGSTQENDFIWALVPAIADPAWGPCGPRSCGPFLGGFRTPGPHGSDAEGWAWVDGSAWKYARWAPTEPTNGGGVQNYLKYWFDPSSPLPEWGDDNVDSSDAFVVEWSADCNGDGIVDYGQCRDGSLPDHNGNNVPDQCEAGRALMWGQNDFGQLDAPPIPLRQINSHAYFTVGIDLDGNLRRWGNPPYPEPYVPATFVAGPFVEVRGRTTTCALRANGEIAIWPLDDQGIQCGLGSPPQGPFVQIAAGAWHAAALRADGSIVVWGCSFSPWNADPVNATPSGGPFRQIACGDFNTHAVRMDGTIASAGYSWDGANGSPSGGQFTKVAGGWGHALALRADGTIAAWGRNVQGECNVPAGQYVDIAAGAASSMALRQDGTVAIWGGCSSSSSGTVWNACSPPGILGPMQIEISGAQAGVVIDMLPCRAADLFADRNVNGADLGILLSQWGIVGQYTVSDLDGSGSVDGVDLGLLLSSWGPCPY